LIDDYEDDIGPHQPFGFSNADESGGVESAGWGDFGVQPLE